MQAYTATHLGSVRWWIRADLEPRLRAQLDPLLEDPERALLGPRSVARSRVGRKRFYHLPGGSKSHAPEPDRSATSEVGLFVKVFAPPSGPAGWLRSLLESRALREAKVAMQIKERGIPAAAPIAVGEARRLGRCVRSYSVIVEEDARDLRQLLLDGSVGPARRQALLRDFGRFSARIHDRGIDQDDTSPNNFLVSDDGRFVLIDFERCRVGESLDRERRLHLLAKLQRHDLGVSRSGRLRFLLGYLAEKQGEAQDAGAGSRVDPHLWHRRLWREWWRAIGDRFLVVRRNDLRRAAAGAFQEGRHVERSGAEWRVRGRQPGSGRRMRCARAEAKRIWVLAHQLERLGLPALRPVRLRPGEVELIEPWQPGLPEPQAAGQHLDPHPTQNAASACDPRITRARREFEWYGRWLREPSFGSDAHGVWLEDLQSFEFT